MRKFTYDELMSFIASGLPEQEYFSGIDYDKESLIHLKDHLEKMRLARKKFIDETEKSFSEIQKKNPWIKMIAPLDMNVLNIYDSNGVYFLLEVGEYNNSFVASYLIPGKSSDKLKAVFRKDFVGNSSDELFDINRKSYDLLRAFEEKKTVSRLFDISNYFNYCVISCGGKNLTKVSIDGEDFIPFSNNENAQSGEFNLPIEDAQGLINGLYLRK